MTLRTDEAKHSAQVLVVGAGPVGLTVAHELLRRGIAVRLIDASPGPATTSRALATHSRTLEIYDQLGLIDELLPRGRLVEAFTLHQNGSVLTRLETDYSHLRTRFPFTVMVDQIVTEEVLRTAVERLGCRVEWGVRLDRLTHDDEAVRVRTHGPGRAVTEAAVPWLVGCDGGHSTVRKQLGLTLVGSSSETWLIADAEVHADVPDDSIHWVRTARGTVMLVPFPEPGRWRLLDTAEADYSGAADEVADRFARKLTAGLGRPVTVRTPTWVSVFTIQQRMLPRMRVGRCFVAGDAAHVHSPASGQGMNTGIQDGYNLGWKLAMVISGQAGEELLDTYPVERVPIGRRLLGSTRKATAIIQLKNPVLGTIVPLAFRTMNALPALRARAQRKIMGEMSALGVAYPAGAVAGDGGPPGAGPRPGERLCQITAEGATEPGWAAVLAWLRDPGWLLLVAGVEHHDLHGIATGQPAWLTVGNITGGPPAGAAPDGTGVAPVPDPAGRLRADLGLDSGGWLLTRPDGYVAARGHRFSADGFRATLNGIVRHGAAMART
jgi:NADPH-dependent dioxygenase